MGDVAKLGSIHKSALLLVRGGADVSGYGLARLLRDVERIEPAYIHIGDRMGRYNPVGQLPYFGAIATPRGVKWAESKSAPKKPGRRVTKKARR